MLKHLTSPNRQLAAGALAAALATPIFVLQTGMSLESLSATLGERMLTNLVNNSMAGSNNTNQPQNGPQNTATQGFSVAGPPPPTNLNGYFTPVGGTYVPAPPYTAAIPAISTKSNLSIGRPTQPAVGKETFHSRSVH